MIWGCLNDYGYCMTQKSIFFSKTCSGTKNGKSSHVRTLILSQSTFRKNLVPILLKLKEELIVEDLPLAESVNPNWEKLKTFSLTTITSFRGYD